MARKAVRTPAAAATSGSTDAKRIERPAITSAASATVVTTTRMRTSLSVTPRNVPKRRLFTLLRLPSIQRAKR